MIHRLLARYPLFRLLASQEFNDWVDASQEFTCDTGETILQENTPGAWVYLVRDGRVRIVRQSGERDLTVGILRPGDVFGEYALLPPGRNTATCRAAAPCRLLGLPLDGLRTALAGRKVVWKNLKNWLRLHTLLHFHRERAFLGFMSAESSLKLLDRLQPTVFAAGQTIQAKRLAGDTWHLIEQGTVRLQSAEFPNTPAVDLGPGDSFGECALAGQGELPVATAQSEVRCQALPRHEFDPSAPIPSKVAQSYQSRLPERPATHVWVPQRGAADCGLAALAMVGLRFEAQVSVEALRAQVTPGPEGLALGQLQQLGMDNRLPCQAVRVSAERLKQVNLPAIAHLSNGHYVVLHELDEAGFVVGDPAAGILTWSTTYLSERYSGVLLLFDAPTERATCEP